MAWQGQEGDRKVALLNDPVPNKLASITACSTGKHEKGDLWDRPFPLPTTDEDFFARPDWPQTTTPSAKTASETPVLSRRSPKPDGAQT
jgi:hypothetical protein